MSDKVCEICQTPLTFRWTDTHGVGACTTCGTPYRILHYEEGKRVELPPMLMLVDSYVPFAVRYWNEHRRNVDPGAFNFPGSDYEVATREDFRLAAEWYEAHREEIEAAAGVKP